MVRLNEEPKTREKATENLYRVTALRVFSDYRNETRCDWTDADGLPFTTWLPTRYLDPANTRRKPITKASWRLYRAALVFTANQQGFPGIGQRISSIVGGTNKSTRQGRVKHLSAEDWDLMLRLVRERSYMPGTLLLFLQASVLTGLRPSEWQRAELVLLGNKPALFVKNAKQTNGRSHGPDRTIYLTGMAPEMVDLVGRQIDHVQRKLAECGSWRELYLQLKHALRRAVTDQWPDPVKRPTLYIARHLFAANAKAAGRTREEVAALMGHASDATATEHYGRRRYGDRRMHQVEPHGPDILRVRHASKAGRTELATRSIIGDDVANQAQSRNTAVSPNDQTSTAQTRP